MPVNPVAAKVLSKIASRMATVAASEVTAATDDGEAELAAADVAPKVPDAPEDADPVAAALVGLVVPPVLPPDEQAAATTPMPASPAKRKAVRRLSRHGRVSSPPAARLKSPIGPPQEVC